MPAFRILLLTLLSTFLISPFVSSQGPNSPTPAPQPGSDVPSPLLSVNSPPSPPPASSPGPSPPPASSPGPFPPPSPSPSPAPAPGTNDTSPAPAPAPDFPSGTGHEADSGESDGSKGGLSGGQKAGIAIGVIAGVFIVGSGAVVYKKRQSNIQRSQLGYDARREFL